MKKTLTIALVSIFLLSAVVGTVSAQDGILPECDPTSTDLKDGGAGCGKDNFAELIINIIGWLEKIIIPIAILVIGWQAFVIMSSTGNAEKVSHATKMIGVAITGIVILLLSHLIIELIFSALNVEDQYLPGGVDKI